MSKVLYLDCFSGASGDMILGSLLDAGLPLEALRDALGSLALDGADISATRVDRAGLAATKFRLAGEPEAAATPRHTHTDAHAHLRDPQHSHAEPGEPAPAARAAEDAADPRARPSHAHGPTHEHPHDHSHHDHDHHHHEHRRVSEIIDLIEGSALSRQGKRRAAHLFERLAEAEAAIHQMPVEQVHLHEVGALDSIVDIVGAVFGLEWMGADRIVASPLNVGSGTIQCAHGTYPVPAPATTRLLAGAPIYSSGPPAELVTPTGALIVTDYAEAYGPIPPMTIARVGYGAGDRNFDGVPNVLRLLVGEAAAAGAGAALPAVGPAEERVAVLECEIDDMNPQIFGVLMDRLYGAGAVEVFYAPVIMKKNRPGTLVTVVAPPECRGRLSEIVFRETTTLGLRHRETIRECLAREHTTVETPWGPVRMKVARRAGQVVNVAPEFEDCASVAAAHGRSVKEVQARAVSAYWLSLTERPQPSA